MNLEKWILWLSGTIVVYTTNYFLKKVSSRIPLLKKNWLRFLLSIIIGVILFVIIATFTFELIN